MGRALAYCAARQRQLERARYVLPALLAILPDADLSTIQAIIDLVAGAPADLFDDAGSSGEM